MPKRDFLSNLLPQTVSIREGNLALLAIFAVN